MGTGTVIQQGARSLFWLGKGRHGLCVPRSFGALGFALLLCACEGPLEPESGPFRLMTKVVTKDHYVGRGLARGMAQFSFGSGSVLLWDSPVGEEELSGVYVEMRIGSQSTDLAFVPVLSWLRSEGATDLRPVELVDRRGARARGIRVFDPGRLLVGQTLAVSGVNSDLQSDQLDTTQVVVRREDYIEVGWPVFTSEARFETPHITMQAHWRKNVLERSGTFVGAWVAEDGEDGEVSYTPVDTWLWEEGRYSPNNLYISEISWRPRFRDRFFSLVGQTLVLAHVVN